MSEEFQHVTVLLEESIEALAIRPTGVYIDCTLGGAGHSSYLLEKLTTGHLYAFDQDQNAIENAKRRLAFPLEENKVTLIPANFDCLIEKLAELGVTQVDGILYDLGVSSPQLDQADRGFSYHQEARLDMRMDQSQDKTAEDVVNDYSYENLVKIFYRYGEEKFSKQIARAIERRREVQRITTTEELVECIKEGIPAAARRKGGHPAKRVFQAIRIEVNNELGALESSLVQAVQLLAPQGRLAVITFHSLEDKLVKNYFRENSKQKDTPPGLPILLDEDEPLLKNITKKPILPSEGELEQNNRARSARLRVVEKNF